MDNRTFWIGLLAGIVGGAIVIGAGYIAIRAFLPASDDDPLSKVRDSFIQTGTKLSRSSLLEEMILPRLERDHAPSPAPLPGLIS